MVDLEFCFVMDTVRNIDQHYWSNKGIPYVTIRTTQNSIQSYEVTLTQQISCGVWMFLAVLFWDLFIAAAIGRPKVQTYLKAYIHMVEKSAGAILIAFGLTLIAGYFT